MVQVRTVDISSWTKPPSSGDAVVVGGGVVPVISPEQEECVKEFRLAMTELGMVWIIGHGIPTKLMDECYASCQEWFSQHDRDTKLRFNHGPYGCPQGGYTAQGIEAVAASESSSGNNNQEARDHPDIIESFVFRGMPKEEEVDEDDDDDGHDDSNNHASTSALLPPAQLTHAARQYYPHMCRLLRILHRILCHALGLVDDPDYFYTHNILSDDNNDNDDNDDHDIGNNQQKKGNNKHSLKFSYYPPSPPQPQKEEKEDNDDHDDGLATGRLLPKHHHHHQHQEQQQQRLRYGAHTDFQDITILRPDPNDWTPLVRQRDEKVVIGATAGTGAEDYSFSSTVTTPAAKAAATTPTTRTTTTKTPTRMMIPTTGGLQVWDRVAQQWIPAILPKISTTTNGNDDNGDHGHDHHHDQGDALCVNLGDFWNIWSDGQFVSPLHRVTNSGWELEAQEMQQKQQQQATTTTTTYTTTNTTRGSTMTATPARPRSSIVFFSVPNPDSIVEPLVVPVAAEGCSSTSSSAGTPTTSSTSTTTQRSRMTAGEHLAMKLARINNNKVDENENDENA